MLAMGAGGMDVAVAMAGGAYYINMPRMFKVNLTGKLPPVGQRQGYKSRDPPASSPCAAGAGRSSNGAARAFKRSPFPSAPPSPTWAPELGATTSIFPADEVTREFLRAQGREEDFTPLASDPDAVYDRVIDIDLSALGTAVRLPALAGQRQGGARA